MCPSFSYLLVWFACAIFLLCSQVEENNRLRSELQRKNYEIERYVSDTMIFPWKTAILTVILIPFHLF